MAFTESQMYHFLRVLTDETHNIAVKRAPVSSSSRFGHFKIRARLRTPRRRYSSDSSIDAQSSSDLVSGSDTAWETDAERGVEAMDLFNGSDSSQEMALISKAFKTPAAAMPVSDASEGTKVDPFNEGFESAGQSNLDPTLSEVRHQRTAKSHCATSKTRNAYQK